MYLIHSSVKQLGIYFKTMVFYKSLFVLSFFINSPSVQTVNVLDLEAGIVDSFFIHAFNCPGTIC